MDAWEVDCWRLLGVTYFVWIWYEWLREAEDKWMLDAGRVEMED